MAKPFIHAKSSVKKLGGQDSDYIEIHNMMDSSKGHFPDNRHRAIFHHSFGVFLMEKMFGIDFTELNNLKEKFRWSEEEVNAILSFMKHCRSHGTCIKNSDGKLVSVREVAEQHCLEDFRMRFIPTLSDYFNNMQMELWYNNAMGASVPPSHAKIKGTDALKEMVKRKISLGEVD